MPRFRFAASFRALALGAVVALGSGCSVSAADLNDSPTARNKCTSHSECGEGYCAANGQCRAQQGQIKTVLVEVTPPASAKGIAGKRLLLPQVALPYDGKLPLELPRIASVAVSVKVATPGNCEPKFATLKDGRLPGRVADGSLPYKVTFEHANSVLGVSSESYTAETVATSDGHSLVANLSIPTGVYNIYVEPSPQLELEDCLVAPAIFPAQSITENVALDLALREPSRTTLTLDWLSGQDSLSEWTADILDADSGRVISSRWKLGLPTQYPGYRRYTLKLAYFPVSTNGGGEELVRLSPPAGSTAPILLTVKSGLGLSMQNESSTPLYPIKALPSAVEVDAAVFEAGTTRGRAATVTLIASHIEDIPEGVFASFSRTVTTDDAGHFQEYLLPGTYRVHAVPSDAASTSASELAAAEVVWEIARTPAFQGGKTIELSNPFAITGRALASGEYPLVGADVQTTASLTALDYSSGAVGWALRRALGETPFVPRASADSVATNGQFTVLADRGTFDITVRPDPTTGFAWHVQPNVKVEMPLIELGQLNLPLPIAYSGVVESVTLAADGGRTRTPVAGAQIRAFIYLSAGKSSGAPSLANDMTQASSVVQIADARADANGNFELLIPAKLNLN